MRLVHASSRGWQSAGTRFGFLIVVMLGVRVPAVWSQDSAQSQIKEEFLEQEKIYHSRGAAGRRVYTTNRGLSKYAELLPSGFCDALGRLGGSDRWLDVGAGEGQAILDYHAPAEPSATDARCRGFGPRARAVAISIEDRRTEKWKQEVARLGDDRLRYLFGKRLRQYAPEELGTFQLITDVYGGFTYTEDLSRFVEKVLSLLEVGGGFYTLATGVRLEDGRDKLGSLYLTEIEDAFGRSVKVCSWLKKISCVEVTCESKSDMKTPTESIRIRKLCSDISVPRMKLVEYEAGYPPGRCFQLEQ